MKKKYKYSRFDVALMMENNPELPISAHIGFLLATKDKEEKKECKHKWVERIDGTGQQCVSCGAIKEDGKVFYPIAKKETRRLIDIAKEKLKEEPKCMLHGECGGSIIVMNGKRFCTRCEKEIKSLNEEIENGLKSLIKEEPKLKEIEKKECEHSKAVPYKWENFLSHVNTCGEYVDITGGRFTKYICLQCREVFTLEDEVNN